MKLDDPGNPDGVFERTTTGLVVIMTLVVYLVLGFEFIRIIFAVASGKQENLTSLLLFGFGLFGLSVVVVPIVYCNLKKMGCLSTHALRILWMGILTILTISTLFYIGKEVFK